MTSKLDSNREIFGSIVEARFKIVQSSAQSSIEARFEIVHLWFNRQSLRRLSRAFAKNSKRAPYLVGATGPYPCYLRSFNSRFVSLSMRVAGILTLAAAAAAAFLWLVVLLLNEDTAKCVDTDPDLCSKLRQAHGTDRALLGPDVDLCSYPQVAVDLCPAWCGACADDRDDEATSAKSRAGGAADLQVFEATELSSRQRQLLLNTCSSRFCVGPGSSGYTWDDDYWDSYPFGSGSSGGGRSRGGCLSVLKKKCKCRNGYSKKARRCANRVVKSRCGRKNGKRRRITRRFKQFCRKK